MAQKSKYHHGDLRSALLEAGEQVLADKGIEGFTLRSVARAAGVSHSAPAHHFKSVNDFFAALTAQSFQRLRDQLKEARNENEQSSPAERIQAVLRAYFHYAQQHPQSFRLMFRFNTLGHEDEQVMQIARDAFIELIEVICEFHQGDIDFYAEQNKANILMLWSLVHGYTHLELEGQLDSSDYFGGAEKIKRLANMIGRVLTLL